MTHQNDDNESLSPQEIKFNDLIVYNNTWNNLKSNYIKF